MTTAAIVAGTAILLIGMQLYTVRQIRRIPRCQCTQPPTTQPAAPVEPPPPATTVQTLHPPVPTDTNELPAVDPGTDAGIDIVRLNRRPRPIKATDLVIRYQRQHPSEH